MKKYVIGLFLYMCACSMHAMEYEIERYVNRRNDGVVVKQPQDQALLGLRTKLSTVEVLAPEKACRIDPTIIMYPLTMPERLGVCYDYAMTQTLKKYGIDKKFKVVGCQEWIQILPYFKHVKKCKKDDLVVYIKTIITKNLREKQQRICHFGRIINQYTLRTNSKFGTIKAVYDHDLFHLPDFWGDEVIVMRLEKAYRTPGINQQMFINDIKRIMQDDIRVRQSLFNYTMQLLRFADVAIYDTEKYKIINFLEQCSHVDLNCCDVNKRTPLILATIKNNAVIVQLLLAYGADKNIKDAWGRTALDYANQHNNQELQDMLK